MVVVFLLSAAEITLGLAETFKTSAKVDGPTGDGCVTSFRQEAAKARTKTNAITMETAFFVFICATFSVIIVGEEYGEIARCRDLVVVHVMAIEVDPCGDLKDSNISV